MYDTEQLLSRYEARDIIEKDKRHLWHHLVPHKVFESQDPKIFVKGEGARVRDIAGNEYLDAPAAAAKSANFLFDEIKQRVASAPIKFQILVQLAETGDTVDDATVRWPDTRKQIKFGEIVLNAIVADSLAEERHIIFDPIPRLDGIEPSADPLFNPRADVYLLSGRRRRSAQVQNTKTMEAG